MKDELITYETAVLAKKKGFSVDGYNLEDIEKYTSDSYLYELPTQSLLQRWLREKHNIHIDIKVEVRSIGINNYKVESFKILGDMKTGIYITSRLDEYEQALEEGLKEALKLI